MHYRLEAEHVGLIHALRYLMHPEGIGVLDRTWEVTAIFGGIDYPYRADTPPDAGAIFPEHQDKAPFLVDGIRLVERLALLGGELEIEIQRLSGEPPHDRDLCLFYDQGHPLIVTTDDAEVYARLDHWFAQISGPWHRWCFP